MQKKKSSEENIKMRSIFLEAVVNSSADGILVVDLTGKIILQNQRTIELWKIPEEVANDPDGMRQVNHVMKMTKNPEQFVAEIEHQKTNPLDITIDELELIDGTVLHRHSAPVLGEDGKNYGRVYHFHDVTGYKRAEDKVRRLLQEKEIILKEVHHRVKNYMTTLIGLLVLHSKTLTEKTAIDAIDDAKSRLTGMMTLYDKLYVSKETGSISVEDYLPALIDEIIMNFPGYEKITVEKEIDELVVNANTLQIVSIILNELLTNIMKYAFAGRSSGNIKIKFKVNNNDVFFSIQDNGIGIKDPERIKSEGGVGLILVNTLVSQLGGSIKFEKNQGTEVIVNFKIEND